MGFWIFGKKRSEKKEDKVRLELEEIKAKVLDLEAGLENVNNSVNEITSNVLALSNEISSLSEDLDSLKALNTQVMDSVSTLESRINTNASSLMEIRDLVEVLAKVAYKNRRLIESLENRMNEFEERSVEIENKINEIEALVKKIRIEEKEKKIELSIVPKKDVENVDVIVKKEDKSGKDSNSAYNRAIYLKELAKIRQELLALKCKKE